MAEYAGLCVKCGSLEVYFKEGGLAGYRGVGVALATRHGTPAVPLETFVCLTCGYTEVRVPPHQLTALQALVTSPKEGWTRLADEEPDADAVLAPGHS